MPIKTRTPRPGVTRSAAIVVHHLWPAKTDPPPVVLEAWRRNVEGESAMAIAASIGVQSWTITDWISRIRALMMPDVEAYTANERFVSAARIGRVERAMAEKAIGEGDAFAAQAAVKASERRSRLLGLDAPTKIAPTDPTGTERYDGQGDPLDQVLADLAARRALRAQAEVIDVQDAP